MTSLIKIAAVVLAFVFAGQYAQGAEPTVITLACDGKVTDARASEAKPEAINNMGLVVNLTERTVSGFERIVAQINKLDAAHISFAGTGNQLIPECRCRN
jgi:hypothetical protein